MKSILIRSIASIIVGILLVAFPNQAAVWLIMLIGLLFLGPGIYSMITYWTMRNEQVLKPFFPLVGLGSTILGLIMVFVPSFFATSLMVALGLLLLIAAIAQIVNVIKARKVAPTPIIFYMVPILLLICGLYILNNINTAIALPFYIAGTAMIVYGIEEMAHYWWLKKRLAEFEQLPDVEDAEDAVVVEEEKSDDEINKPETVE